ncbi:hypothetical protein ABZ863_25215 [Saccharomonospora sp. NPDC046836]|uniref:hypothetical protein n=1 Tax=Saccharomonospora sp. NPDC046836 TaxID=3156921 RepID=UPI0033E782AD
MKIGHFLLALFVLFVLPVLAAGQAQADGARSGGDLQIAQTLGARELTVIVRRIDVAPGPVRIEIVTHAGSPRGTLDLRLRATGTDEPASDLPPAGTVTSAGTIELGEQPGLYGATFTVDRPGPWELAVDDGERTALIPFIVPAPAKGWGENAIYGGFAAAGGFLLLALVLAVRSRRTWLPLVPAAGVVAAVSVSVTAALLAPSVPPPPAPGSQLDPTVGNVTDPLAAARQAAALTELSRPPVNLALHAPAAVAGEPVELELSFLDASTGRPVDDLLVHHNAFAHLVVVGPSGQLWHLHPIRVAPGSYRATFVPTQAGTHAAAAELSRRGGGVQLARSPSGFEVGGTGTAQPAPPGPGTRTVEGTEVDLSVTTTGDATTITARIGTNADLQPWLGMTGHLIMVGPIPEDTDVGAAATAATTWAHGHAMAPVSNTVTDPPDETVAAFGPEVRFTHTFGTPGRYLIWVQVERNYSVLTIPAVLDVPATKGTP